MSFATLPNYLEILRQPGLLYWNPTNLAAEATWGDLLGFCAGGIEFDPGYKFAILKGMETGEEPIMKPYLGCEAVLKATLRNYNADALGVLFPGLNSALTVKYPNTILPGTDLFGATYAKAIMFVPEDQANNIIFLLQKASPNIVAAIRASRVKDTVFPAIFHGARKSSDADGFYYIGNISGATLR